MREGGREGGRKKRKEGSQTEGEGGMNEEVHVDHMGGSKKRQLKPTLMGDVRETDRQADGHTDGQTPQAKVAHKNVQWIPR